jgi:NarL family two-component system response regulator LiaR
VKGMTGSEMIRVLIADDHQVVRQGLRTFLDLHEDIHVVGEAENGEVAVELSRSLTPNVVLMDLVMPRLDGISAIKQIVAMGGEIRIIALTSFTEDEKVFPAIEAGASSYLLKDVSPEDLVDAIRAVHQGEARLHPEIARKLMEQVARERGRTEESPLADLTEREREVVSLVAHGLSNREIAQQLSISHGTVKTHVSSILSKLNLNDRTQLAIFAINEGLVDGK